METKFGKHWKVATITAYEIIMHGVLFKKRQCILLYLTTFGVQTRDWNYNVMHINHYFLRIIKRKTSKYNFIL